MKLGVIGGLGPLASAYYYELLTKMSLVEKDQDHLEVIIHSCPQIPDRTKYILNHKEDNPVHEMIKIAKELEQLKVDFIAIPCITAHYFHHDLEKSTHVPIIHLIEEICDYLEKYHIDSVGIMATDGTIQSQLFQDALKTRGIQVVVPSHEGQEDVMHIIYQNVKLNSPIEKERFDKVSRELKSQGAQLIILGCTELSMVKREFDLDESYLDAMELLAAIALHKCQMTIREEYQYLIG